MNAQLNRQDVRPQPTRIQRLTAGALCTLVFIVIYVASAGPMAGLHAVFEFQQFQDALEIVYGPVIAVGESDLEPVASLLRSYIGLFR